jgi:hypothetical protein
VYNISRMSLKICIKFSFEYMEKRIREKFKWSLYNIYIGNSIKNVL